MVFPDDFSDTTVYKYKDHYYAIRDDTWYRLWGWVPHGGREATAVTDEDLIEQLEASAMEHPFNEGATEC